MICSVRSHNDVIKTTIPVQSTMLSTGFIIFFSGLSAYLINVTQDLHLRPYDRPIGKGLLIVALAAQMPLILGLTVKNQQKNQRPSPPPGLQFHGVSANLKKKQKKYFSLYLFQPLFEPDDENKVWTSAQPTTSVGESLATSAVKAHQITVQPKPICENQTGKINLLATDLITARSLSQIEVY